MRKKSTRLLSAALAVCMMLSVLPVGAFAAEPGAAEPENGVSAQADPVGSEFVEINDTNFPDPVFQQYVKDNIDTADTTSGQKDGRLSKAERDAVTTISIDNKNCTDLTGIAYFANLTELDCSDNQLTTLDVSKNAKLRILRCYNNGMEKLNLGDITHLTLLNCDDNNLTELDVSKNPDLKDLECRENKLRRVVIGKKYSLTTLYLRGNQLTSLDLSTTRDIWNLDDLWQRRAIDVNEDGTFDLSSFLPEGFDEDKTSAWLGCDKRGSILKVNSHRVRYLYNTGSTYNGQKRMTVILAVNQHKYQWQHDDTKHWRTCELDYCPGLTDAQEAPHVYDNAKDNNCNTCGYVRPLYTVTTVNATAKLESEAEELKAPVAAGTEVTLTAGNAPEGKTFAGWKLYKVSDTESEITDETELAKLLENGIATTATLTLTMPAYDVKAEPYYSNIPYNIKAVDCTVDKTEAAKGDTVTATRRKPEANERFIDWTVKVNGVEQDTDTFLTPDADDPTKVSFVMPAENVEIKANFASNPTLNPTLRVGDHVTATIDGSDTPVPSGSAVLKNTIVHLTAIAPDGQHFTGWTVKVGSEEQKADTFLKTPDASDPTKVTFTMPNADVEVTATFAENPIPEPDPVGPSDTGNIQGAISAVVVGAAAGAIIYEAGTGIYRVINMPGIPMPSNRIELAELLWEHAGKPEPESTALYSDIDEGDTDAQKAARWAVEQDLMKDDADNNKFHPAFPVSKLRTCLTWNAAKEKGLFDKTEE